MRTKILYKVCVGSQHAGGIFQLAVQNKYQRSHPVQHHSKRQFIEELGSIEVLIDKNKAISEV
jgi:hypothetical protein